MRGRTPARVPWAAALVACWLAPGLGLAQVRPVRVPEAELQPPPAPPPVVEPQPPPEPVPPVEIPEPTTAVPVPPAGVERQAAEGRIDSEGHRGWLDRGHRFLEAAAFWPFIRLDDFFASERQVRPKAPGSLIHWRQDLVARADGTFGYATSLRANLKFPFLTHRWDRLVLDVRGQSDDAIDRLLPDDGPIPAKPREVSVGVGLTFWETLQTDTDARVGLLAGLPPGYYARLRLRHAVPFGEVLLCRLATTGFWQTNTGWGTSAEVDLDRLLAFWLFSRLAGGATLTQRSRGLEWGEELSLTATAGRSAFALVGGFGGATDAGPVVEVWRVLTRARRDVFRRWLFLELEPQVSWTRRPGGGRAREAVVLLRLDVQFEQRPAVRSLREGDGGDPHARP